MRHGVDICSLQHDVKATTQTRNDNVAVPRHTTKTPLLIITEAGYHDDGMRRSRTTTAPTDGRVCFHSSISEWNPVLFCTMITPAIRSILIMCAFAHWRQLSGMGGTGNVSPKDAPNEVK